MAFTCQITKSSDVLCFNALMIQMTRMSLNDFYKYIEFYISICVNKCVCDLCISALIIYAN